MAERVNILSDNYLHYDLNFLEPGNIWKPMGDSYRMNNYVHEQEQFELEPADLIRKIFPKGLLDITDYNSFIHFNRLLGYPRLLTLKTIDMVVGQPPIIQAEAKKDTTQKIRETRNRTGFNGIFKQALIDYSRFGVMLLRIYKGKKDNKPYITAWDPNEWVPVFYPDGTNRIHYNVIGWRYENTLTLQIHNTEDGSYEERICTLDGACTIQSIDSVQFYNKESGRCLLYAFTNTPTTTNPLGTSDYVIINALLQKAIERLTAILRVLDEHADPSMTGPSSLLSKDDRGELVFKTSRYYAVQPEEKEPKYLVWEANLESSFKAFETLCEQIYILSEMGPALVGAKEGVGNVVSGTALRFKMISPLEKARRIQNDLTEPLKELISTLMYLEGEEIEAKDINIFWKDSLPKDPTETANLVRTEAGAAASKPLINSLQDNYDLDDETAKAYYDGIIKDLEKFAQLSIKAKQELSKEDGRSHKPGSSLDPRKQDSPMDPASSENRGDDER